MLLLVLSYPMQTRYFPVATASILILNAVIFAIVYQENKHKLFKTMALFLAIFLVHLIM